MIEVKKFLFSKIADKTRNPITLEQGDGWQKEIFKMQQLVKFMGLYVVVLP